MKFLAFAISLAFLLAGCVTKNNSRADVNAFESAMAALDGNAADSAAAKKGISRFKTMFASLKSPDFKDRVAETYAESAYFNDTLVELHGRPAIVKYLGETAKNTGSLEMIYKDLAHSGGNYYLRWVMVIRSKTLSHGEPLYSTGVTLLRFDSEGRVTLHQDYWDSASGFYKHLPVLGPQIEFIQSRLQKSAH